MVTCSTTLNFYEVWRASGTVVKAKIVEWNYQKKLSAEVLGYLDGNPDVTGRMRWLPKLLFTRFLDDFRLRFPALESFVNDPQNTNRATLRQELQTIPQSWQRSDP